MYIFSENSFYLSYSASSHMHNLPCFRNLHSSSYQIWRVLYNKSLKCSLIYIKCEVSVGKWGKIKRSAQSTPNIFNENYKQCKDNLYFLLKQWNLLLFLCTHQKLDTKYAWRLNKKEVYCSSLSFIPVSQIRKSEYVNLCFKIFDQLCKTRWLTFCSFILHLKIEVWR